MDNNATQIIQEEPYEAQGFQCQEDREERPNWCWVHQSYWSAHGVTCEKVRS